MEPGVCLYCLMLLTFIKLQCCTSETHLWLLVLNATEFTLPALSIELTKNSQSVWGCLGHSCFPSWMLHCYLLSHLYTFYLAERIFSTFVWEGCTAGFVFRTLHSSRLKVQTGTTVAVPGHMKLSDLLEAHRWNNIFLCIIPEMAYFRGLF